jgi:hypothetical protein
MIHFLIVIYNIQIVELLWILTTNNTTNNNSLYFHSYFIEKFNLLFI